MACDLQALSVSRRQAISAGQCQYYKTVNGDLESFAAAACLSRASCCFSDETGNATISHIHTKLLKTGGVCNLRDISHWSEGTTDTSRHGDLQCVL